MKGGAGKGIVVGLILLAFVAGAIVMGRAAESDRKAECDAWGDRYLAAVDAAIEDGSVQALATGEAPPPGAQKVLDVAEEKPEGCTPPQADIPFPQSG